MTVAELIKRLDQLPKDALVLKRYGNRGDEYVEINDWLDVIDVQKAKSDLIMPNYHWWDCKSRHYDNRDEHIITEAVVL